LIYPVLLYLLVWLPSRIAQSGNVPASKAG
jgi:hypothetical protein